MMLDCKMVVGFWVFFFFFKQKTAYEMRISDWSSDVCSSDLVDHVLPRSRSQDNGYQNRVLCFAKANQDKKQRTPWEWQGRTDRVWWDEFEARVRALSIKGFKKRNLLMRNFDEREQG